MARVTKLKPSDLSGDARTVFERIEREYGPFGSMLSVFAHRPPALEHVFGLLLASRADALLSQRHLEIVLLSASAANACAYCVAHHAPRLVEQGLPQAAADRILDDAPPGFDETDIVLRDYAVQVTRDAKRVSDDLFAKLRARFDEAQVVEITVRAALCAFFARFNEALRIEVEPGVQLPEVA